LKLKLIAVGSAAALMLVPVAAAKSHHHGHHRGQHYAAKIRAHATDRGGVVSAAVTYLGLDRAAIVAKLRSGQSLAQIAVAQGKTADGLVQALLAPAKLKLDAAVAAGRLTAAQETAVLGRIQTALTNIVNHVATPKPERPVRVSPASILQPALSYLGLDFRAVVTQLRSGKTLAQIAVDRGKTAAGLVDAVVASVKSKLDARVAAGKLSAAAESTFLAALQANVTKLVNGA
jgi:hypothetical protein